MKKINWLLLIVILAALAAGYWGASTDFFVGKVEKGSLSISISAIHQRDDFFNVQAEYPQFKNAGENFNGKISDLVTGRIDDFKKNSLENWSARKATAPPESPLPDFPEQPFDFIAEWEPAQINDEYVSFVLKLYYYAGGAHGLNEVYGFDYDVQNRKEITILDFLNSSQQALDKLAGLARQNVSLQLQNNGAKMDGFLKQMLEEGTAPTAENYANFTFNYDSLTVYFQQYQVAPGAFGLITSVFYKSVLDANSITSGYLR